MWDGAVIYQSSNMPDFKTFIYRTTQSLPDLK